MIDTVYILGPHKGSRLRHKLESWCPNSRKNGVSKNGENQKSVGCVVAKLQWLIETCPVDDVLH